MEKELSGMTALVTGASRGIGAATVALFSRQGAARLLIHYNTHREGAERAAAGARAAGAEAETVQANLGTVEGIEALAGEIRRRNAPIDILVNNAGSLVKRAKLLEFTPDLFDEVVNLNVKSLWFLTQAVAPAMIDRGSGAIVNVSSIAARNGGGPGATIYSAAKAAVSAITKGLAKELAPRGIRVNAVSPGTVDNHFHEVFSTAPMLESMRQMTPAGTLGTNEEVADTILFLCSRAGRYIHGQTIEVNGGMYMV
ncbi:MAG: SDR family NAD(P)-dependent oxidoreductase [Bryobacteraceae bacterium]